MQPLIFVIVMLGLLWSLTAKVLFIKVMLTAFFVVWVIGGKCNWTKFNTPENGNKCILICIIASAIAISSGCVLFYLLCLGTSLNTPLGLFVFACILPGAYINYKFGPLAVGTFHDLEHQRMKAEKRLRRQLKA